MIQFLTNDQPLGGNKKQHKPVLFFIAGVKI